MRLAGILKNKSFTRNVVPSGAPISSLETSLEPSIRYRVPVRASAVLVINSTLATAAMLESASPLNPSECTHIRSSALRILLVE